MIEIRQLAAGDFGRFICDEDASATAIMVREDSWKSFQELIQRGANLWPDAPPEIKKFADLVTTGQVMQEYAPQSLPVVVTVPLKEI
jgi:hypothetical protein